MADTDETFDPNDLESIDALLDEAELEAADVEPDAVDEPDALDELDGLDDLALDSNDETDDLLDSLEDLVPDMEPEPEPEVVAVSEPMALEESPSRVEPVSDDMDDFLAKRASAQAAQNPNVTADDMDSIKKLIIIFGSVLTVFALTGIGIGVWSALAASSAGIDEETQTLIESIKVTAEQNGIASTSAEKVTKSVEKKLDAINFQLTQLTEDLNTLEKASKDDNETVIDPLSLNSAVPGVHDAKGTQVVAAVTQAAQAAATTKAMPTTVVQATVNPELLKKVGSVNSKLIKAQRRIDEVNKRVKQIQVQYKAMMHSVKIVEKQVLMEQAEKAEKTKVAEEKMQQNRYQYNSPDGMFYDQSVSDSYP